MTRLNAAMEGRYRMERELGRGGMATVYLARDLRHERRVALKVLQPELAAVVGGDRFLAEIRTTATLQHPHILPLFDSGEADGFLFYVMPYVEGDSLRKRLDRERQLPVDEAVGIGIDLAEALDYAHRQGVIHRDIKPANVLMLDGKPVIADFGIALAVGTAGGGRLTETGLSLGTPHYMSPEQSTGDVHVGPAADIYALGCVVYELLAGEPPFTGSTPQAVLGRIITGEHLPLREQRPSVPANVDAAIDRSLERIPADRFGTARELAVALRDPSFRHGGDRRGEDDAVGRLAWAGWGVAAALAVALGWSLLAGPGGATGEEYFDLVLPPDLGVPDVVGQSVAVHPDGDRVFYVARDPDGRQMLHSRAFSEPDGLPVPGAGTAVGSIFLSPDGEWIAFNDVSEGSVKKIPAGGGAAVTLVESGLDPDANGWLGGDWGPEGTIVFATAGRPDLFSVSEDGGDARSLVSPEAPDSVRYREPSFLPDGSGMVFTAAARGYPWENRIMMARFDDDAEPMPLVTGHSPRVTPDGYLLFGRSGTGDRKGELWQASLSADFTAVEGEPRRLRDDIRVSGSTRDRWLKMDVGTDGTLIYVPGTDNNSNFLAWVDRAGSTEPILTPDSPQLPSGVIGFDAPRLSPSGDRIAFRASVPDAWPGFRLFILERERGSILTLSVDANADWPLWTPDGERIAFNRFDGETQDLYWIRSDNVGPAEPLLPENPQQQHAGAFTPDGRTLILQEREVVAGPDSDIRIFEVGEDEGSQELIDTDTRAIHPVLSPNGRWLAYVSDESGQWEVYVTDFPDRRTRVKVSTEAAWQPAWHPRGGELFYRRFGLDAVISVPYSVSEGRFMPGAPTVLFESEGRFRTCCSWARDYDVTADGERFLMVRVIQGETASSHLEVIRRWEHASGR